MRISAVKTNFNSYKLNFKSLRKDKEVISRLSSGDKTIQENEKLNILTALNNMSNYTDKENISFLLNVAEDLQYGQNGDSEFKDKLDEDGITPSERENTNWNKILEDTIYKALSNSQDEDLGDLQMDYYEIFGKKKELTHQEEILLNLRKDLTNYIINDDTLSDADNLDMVTNIRKNIDYFIASSEIPSADKEICLEELIDFMSDNYKITPQLSDKKLQILDEILNDLVVKTPEDKILKTKDIDQLQTGMCAAISIARKAICYEDKVRFVEIIKNELNDSPTMPVFDVTELGSGKTVDIPKIDINYDVAMEKGYRIIDASVHQWMQNAHASGDGSIITEKYIAFDDDNYGIYHDSSWYVGIDEKYSDEKNLLMALIKEKEALKAVQSRKKRIADAKKNITEVKNETFGIKSKVIGEMLNILRNVFSRKNENEITDLFSSINNFYSGISEDNEVNMAPKLPSEVKEDILFSFIESQVKDIKEEEKSALKDNIGNFIQYLDLAEAQDAKLQKLSSFNTSRAKYKYNRDLYKLAAAHRIALEADVNLPNGVMRFEKESGLPPRTVQIVNYLKSLKNGFSSPAVREKYSDGIKILSKEELESEIDKDILEIETIIPAEIDAVTNTILDKNTKELVIEMYNSYLTSISSGDTDTLVNVQRTMGLTKKDKTEVLAFLQKIINNLKNPESSSYDLQDAVRLLGFENEVEFSSLILTSFVNSLTQGISEEEYEKYAKKFGGKDKILSGFETQRMHFINSQEKYLKIIDKWNIPSSRANIMTRLEKMRDVLSREELDILKADFDNIQKQVLKNKSIKNLKQRQKANSKVYNVSNESEVILNKIEKSIPFIKRYSKRKYIGLNHYLKDALDEQSAKIGRLTGQFWIREDGSTGLFSAEQTRIFEQMTGKPYQIVYDIEDVASYIKDGNGTGILNESVDDADYGFHAQYVPLVTTEIFRNHRTGQTEQKDVVWTDNSWGKIEREHFWNGHNGHYYTDYNDGLGWKNGFIISEDYKTGSTVDEIKNGHGFHKGDNEEFALFRDFVLPGSPVNTYTRLYKLYEKIISIGQHADLLNEFEAKIVDGYKFSPDEIAGYEDLVELKIHMLEKRLNDEIKSEEDFKKLPDDDILKILFKKVAMYYATENTATREEILELDKEDLEDFAQKLVDKQVAVLEELAAKNPEGNMTGLFADTSYDLNDLLDNMEKDFNLEFDKKLRADIFADIFFDPDAFENYDGRIDNLYKIVENQISISSHKNIENEEAAKYFEEKAREIILNSFENNIRIKSLTDNALKDSPLKDKYIGAIDKYLKPVSNKELLLLMQQLQTTDYEESDKFFDVLQAEDVGVNIKNPYYYIMRYKDYDSSLVRTVSNIVLNDVLNQYVRYTDDENKDITPEGMYRNLYVTLSNLDVNKYIKDFKVEALQKYNVRPALPESVVLSDDLLEKTATDIVETIREEVSDIQNEKIIVEQLKLHSKIIRDYKNTDVYKFITSNKDFVITDENKITLDNMVEDFKKMYSLAEGDPTLKDFNKSLTLLISLLSAENGVIEGAKANTYLKNIFSLFDDFNAAGINLTTEIQQKKEDLKTLKYNIKLAVASNIEPKYRNDVTEVLKKLINSYYTAEDEEIYELENEFINMFVDKHISKKPIELLNTVVKLLLNGEKNNPEYEVLKKYLLDALEIAAQTEIQYKLIQNQHLGISSKLKDVLPSFYIQLKDGQKYTLDSNMGMLYLVNTLGNNADNYITLNLFLEQSGLCKKALKSIIDNLQPEKTVDVIDDYISQIKKEMNECAVLNKLITEFFDKSQIKFNSLESTIKHLVSFLKRRLNDWESSDTYKLYFKYMDSLQYVNDYKLPTRKIISMFTSVNQNALHYISDDINQKLDMMDGFNDYICSQNDMILRINVPTGSEEYKIKEEFLENAVKYQSIINEKISELNDFINTSGMKVSNE